MEMSQSIKNLAEAMSKFQAELEQPEKSADNPFFKSKYVPLPSVIAAIKKFGAPHGLSYMQMPVTNERGTGIQTIVMHSSGEYIKHDPFFLPMDKQTAQGAGSSITYSRRYSLSAAFGIDSDPDDDGNAASGNNNNENRNRNNNQQQNKKQQRNNSPKASEQLLTALSGFIDRMVKEKKLTIDTVLDTLEKKKDPQSGKLIVGPFGRDIKNMTMNQASAAIGILKTILG